MKKKEHEDELPPLYEVEVLPVERRLNHPGRRASDPKPQFKKKP